MSQLTKPLYLHIPDTRGVVVSRYGKGNLKIGANVYTYSRLPGHPDHQALGGGQYTPNGTCPGATVECQAICYAARPVIEQGLVYQMWTLNSLADDVPPIPDECRLLRIHVSGDFDTPHYIRNWIERLADRPDVAAWAYTRSWRVPELLPTLSQLKRLPNIQLFASMDSSTTELPPAGWRIAWIDGDARLRGQGDNRYVYGFRGGSNILRWSAYVCPEETGRRRDCEQCGYCFKGQKHDVVFLKH